jgi:hypothetical protein
MSIAHRFTFWFIGISFLLCIGFAIPVFADTCPTNISQDSKGFWTSNEAPGWKSTEGKPGVTLDIKDFGGVVYSPEKKRIACVYKDSTGEWVVLLSSVDHAFEKEDLQGTAWEYNDKYKDYECGTPKSALKDCVFNVKK